MDAQGGSPIHRVSPRRSWPLDALGLTAGAAFAGLAILSHRAASVPLGAFFLVMGIAWMTLLLAWKIAVRWPVATVVRRIWFWGVIFRLIGFAAEPVLEDDYWRYLWDGRQLVLTGNPYATAPMDHFTETNLPLRFQQVLNQINYPEVPTLYGPVCQFAFGLSYWVAPGRLWPLKLILIAADLLTLRMLFSLAAPRDVILYAWCPLLIQETAFTAHPESLAISWAVLALWAFRSRRWGVTAVGLALSAGAKIPALLLAPFLLWPAPKRDWLAFGLMLAALHLPFVGHGTVPGLAGTAAFALHWEFNSTAYALVKGMASEEFAKGFCAAAFLVFYTGFFLRSASGAWHGEIPRGDWLFGVFFLLSAVVNPWYLLWLLPFVVLRPSAMGLAALAMVSLSYAHGLNLGATGPDAYEHPGWVRPLEVGVIALAAVWDGRWKLFCGRSLPAKGEGD